jgi:uncharacterized protein (DUF608 family)
LRTYRGEHLRAVAMPIGGIGTGTVSLGGRGDLRDWEIGNRPAKGFAPRHSFFALRAALPGVAPVTRVLEGEIPPPYEGWAGARATDAGLPRFRRAVFRAAYPLAQVELADPAMPVTVRLEAFNPLVPGDAAASGIPVAVLRWVVANPGGAPVDVTVCGSVQNVVGALRASRDDILRVTGFDLGPRCHNVNELRSDPEIPLCGVFARSDGVVPTAEMWGTLALGVLEPPERVTMRGAWADISWGDTLADFWRDLHDDARLDDRARGSADKPMASVAARATVAPGEERPFTFLLAWHFPNRMTWTPESGVPWVLDQGGGTLDRPAGEPNPDIVGNWYVTRDADAWAVAARVARELPELEHATVDFVREFSRADLPVAVKDAALASLTALRSQTTFRAADGHLYRWEGTGDDFGCCPGSCTHVWNYEHATPLLFADLARSMREVEFLHATRADGLMAFRVHLPLERGTEWGLAAADGQAGCIVRLYREWQMAGDDDWLRRLWPRARRAVEFCWIPGGWDADRDGVMEGCQHNTMDCEYFGPNPQMGLWYLAALRAAAAMARRVGDEPFASECEALFARGSGWIDAHLFNGEYYEHEVRAPGTRDAIAPGLETDVFGEPQDYAQPRGQLGAGCLVDQAVGQVAAHAAGLGHLVDPEHLRAALASVWRHNRRTDLHAHVNDKRAFALADESGLLMASFPRGRPERPFTYADEVMTGFEYTAAAGMLYEGLVDEGLAVIEAVRARYDGRRRNPFDEAECGHHYVRAMAVWATVLAVTGLRWSAVDGRLSLRLPSRRARRWWSTGAAWGTATLAPGDGGCAVTLRVHRGELELRRLAVDGAGEAVFDPPRRLAAGARLRTRIG